MARRITAVACVALALAMAAPAAADDAGRVVATVGGTEITLGHMITLRANLPEQFNQLADDVLFEGILDQLVEQAALAQSAGDDISLRARLQLDNVTNEIVANSLLSASAGTAISDEAIEGAYALRYVDGEAALEYNAAHILVETEEEAIALRAELDAGAEFATLAREHSLDPGSGSNGGELGWFGPDMMVEPFGSAVTELAPGELSEPIGTQFGWHIILLNETRETEAPELDLVRDDLVRELQQAAVMEHIERVRAAADIELSAEGIDPALLRDQTLLDQ